MQKLTKLVYIMQYFIFKYYIIIVVNFHIKDKKI